MPFDIVSKKRTGSPQGWFDGEAVRERSEGNPSALCRFFVSAKKERAVQSHGSIWMVTLLKMDIRLRIFMINHFLITDFTLR